jgi:hypothetical protein
LVKSPKNPNFVPLIFRASALLFFKKETIGGKLFKKYYNIHISEGKISKSKKLKKIVNKSISKNS